MGYKVLQPYNEQDPSTAFAEQIKDLPNTIFEIRDVFDLGGTQEIPVSVTLPAGSTLKFNGGAIKNCTLQCSLTQIQDDVALDNVVITGSVKNDELKLSWWKLDNSGNDSTYAVNNNSFQCLLTSSYNTSRPAIIDRGIRVTTGFTANHDLICEQYITYYGDPDYDGGVVTISGSMKNYRLKVSNNSRSGDFATRSAYPIKGVSVKNLYKSDVYIDEIVNFTVNLCIDCRGSLYSFGDNFYIKQIRNAYKNLQILHSGSGWFTESRFIGGTYKIDSDCVFNTHSIAISFEGTGTTCNNLIFENCDIEANYIGIYVNDAIFQDSRFINFRNESVTKLIEEVNVPTINEAYKSTLSVYRWDSSLLTFSSKLFNVKSSNDYSYRDNTYYWNIDSLQLENGRFSFLSSLAYRFTPGHLGYYLSKYAESDEASLIDGRSDVLKLYKNGIVHGSCMLFEHNGTFKAKFKALFNRVNNDVSLRIRCIAISKNLTYHSSVGYYYKAVSMDDVVLLGSGISVLTENDCKFIQAEAAKRNIQTTSIAFNNIPSNTYILFLVFSSEGIGSFEVTTDIDNIRVNTDSSVFSCNSTPVKVIGKISALTEQYYDSRYGKLCRLYINQNSEITSIKSNGFSVAPSRGNDDNKPTSLMTATDAGYNYFVEDISPKRNITWNGGEWTEADGSHYYFVTPKSFAAPADGVTNTRLQLSDAIEAENITCDETWAHINDYIAAQTNMTSGGFVNRNSGSITISGGYKYSDFIDIEGATKIVFLGIKLKANSTAGAAYYSSNSASGYMTNGGVVYSYDTSLSQDVDLEYTKVPISGAKFFRFTCLTNSSAYCKIYYGDKIKFVTIDVNTGILREATITVPFTQEKSIEIPVTQEAGE